MEMKPFCGYNFGDYWAHWIGFSKRSAQLPKVFHVNWFRKDADGRFLWPGYGDNMRVLKWIVERCAGRAGAQRTPIGNVPNVDELETTGIDLKRSTLEALLAIDPEIWSREVDDIAGYFASFGGRLPDSLMKQVVRIKSELARQLAA